MSTLKTNLEGRGLQRGHVKRAIEFTEKVIAQVVNNASKNTTGAQAMKGNLSTLTRDLEVLYDLEKEFAADEKAAAPKRKPAAKEVEADVSPEAEAS